MGNAGSVPSTLGGADGLELPKLRGARIVPDPMRLLPSLALLLAATIGPAQAYPGADAGERPWQPAKGRPAPLAGLKLLPPTAVFDRLREAGVPSSQFAFHVRRVDAPRAVAALNDEQPMVMASTAKVITTLAALDLLGNDHRWHTRAYLQGEITDGRLAGDLLIVGGGDASLTSDSLRRWFTQLQAHGLREIDGDIVLDRLAFRLSPDDLARTPMPDPERPYHAWPDALPLDAGVLRVVVSPQGKGQVALRMQPVLDGIKLVSAVAAGPGCAAQAELAAPLTLKVSGTLAPECGEQQLALMPLSHAEFSARAIAALWAEAGGRLHGQVVERGRAAPDDVLPEPLAVLDSEPLPVVVREINKYSHNLLARNLWLTLSPDFPHHSATSGAAIERVQQWLQTQGLKADDVELDTGSGLSRNERAKPRALAQLLAKAWSGPHAREFVPSLPVAGVDGTLTRRFLSGPATGNAFLKTGSLLDARALAGYVKSRGGKVYAVAAMINHPDAAAATPALDALIEWIAERD